MNTKKDLQELIDLQEEAMKIKDSHIVYLRNKVYKTKRDSILFYIVSLIYLLSGILIVILF